MNRIWGQLLASVSENEGIENTDFTHFLEFDIVGFRKEMSVTLLKIYQITTVLRHSMML